MSNTTTLAKAKEALKQKKTNNQTTIQATTTHPLNNYQHPGTTAREIIDSIQTQIKTIRKKGKISQKELAYRCGYSQTTIHRIENGKGGSTFALIAMLAGLNQTLVITPINK